MDAWQLDLERCILALETQNRRWRLGTACLVAAFVWTCYANPVQDVLRVRSLALVDARDRTYAELKLTEEGPGLHLFDAEGITRVSLTHSGEETALYIRDEDDQVRIGVAQFAHGGGGVALHGPAARGAAVLYYKEEGSLTFYDAEGKVIARSPDAR